MKYFFALVFVILSCATSLKAQDGGTLLDQISALGSKHNIVFSYNEGTMRGIKLPAIELSDDLQTALKQLSENTAFEFDYIDGENVLVKAKKPGKNLQLCLTLTDAKSGEPVGAAVVYNGKDPEAATSDMDGKAHLLVNLNEWDSVVIRSVGYARTAFPIQEFNGAGCVTLSVEPSTSELEEFTIMAYMNSNINYVHDDQSINLDMNGAGLLPGETETDIFTSIEALPGINSPSGKAGNLIMRGDDPDKTLITFDDIPIYHKGHYFGTFSPYNVNVIEGVKISRNGYGADNGGRVGGVIQMSSEKVIPDSAQYGLGASTSYLSGYANVPLIEDKWSLMVGARTSYPFDWNSPKIEAITDFVFQNSVIDAAENNAHLTLSQFDYLFYDFNAKSIFKINDKNEISVSFLQIQNEMDLVSYDDVLQQTGVYDIDLTNQGVNAQWKTDWNSRISTANSVTASYFKQGFLSTDSVTRLRPDSTLETLTETNDFINTVEDVGFKSTTTMLLGDYNHIDFGYHLQYHDVMVTRNLLTTGRPPVSDVSAGTGLVNSLFGNYTLGGQHRKINGTLGLRAVHFSETNKVYLEPRLLVNTFLTDYLTLKLNAGMYNQFVNHLSGVHAVGVGIENFNYHLSNSSTIPVVSSQQTMLGAVFNKEGWIVDVEAYYRHTDNLATMNLNDARYINAYFVGTSQTVGVDVMVKKSWKGLDTWISYTRSRTEVQFDSIQEDPFRSVWDQSNVFSLVASYKYKGFSVSAGWKYRTGLAVLDGIRNRYLGGPTSTLAEEPITADDLPPGAPPPPPITYISDSDPEYIEDFPNHHQLDISVSYKLQPKGKDWNINFGAAALNVYDNRIVVAQRLRRVRNAGPNTWIRSNTYGLGFAPSFMIMVNF